MFTDTLENLEANLKIMARLCISPNCTVELSTDKMYCESHLREITACHVEARRIAMEKVYPYDDMSREYTTPVLICAGSVCNKRFMKHVENAEYVMCHECRLKASNMGKFTHCSGPDCIVVRKKSGIFYRSKVCAQALPIDEVMNFSLSVHCKVYGCFNERALKSSQCVHHNRLDDLRDKHRAARTAALTRVRPAAKFHQCPGCTATVYGPWEFICRACQNSHGIDRSQICWGNKCVFKAPNNEEIFYCSENCVESISLEQIIKNLTPSWL